MTSFFARLEARIRQVDSLLCVGLDPHPADLPAPTLEAVQSFCLRLIDATADLAAAFKPNAAFFEAYGSQGYAVLEQIIAAVPDGVPLILDAKRGDIASTAQAYARAAFQALGADAITASPFLGRDSLAPFLEDPSHGVFLLCKTSNPGAGDLQDLPTRRLPDVGISDEAPLYEIVARLAQEWNTRDNLGLVAGATQLEALRRVRTVAPDLWILAPGVGAQGGDLAAALRAGLRPDGLGLLIPVSRGISRAADPRQAALDLRDEINRHRAAVRGQLLENIPQAETVDPRFSHVADGLLAAGCVRFGEFTLKSGLQSPVYLDLRRLAGYPRLLSQVAAAYLPLLQKLEFTRLAALPYAALPIGTAISLAGGWPLVYPRKEAKAYGTRAEIEGVFQSGEQVVVIDDLATTGGSKFEAIEKLVQAGLRVKDVVVLIDRQSGAGEALAQAGYHLHAVFTLTRLLDHWEHTAQVPGEKIAAVRAFLAQTNE